MGGNGSGPFGNRSGIKDIFALRATAGTTTLTGEKARTVRELLRPKFSEEDLAYLRAADRSAGAAPNPALRSRRSD